MKRTGLKIGQLAEQTGITVRTLHYYDEIDLLKSSQYTDSGHRIYTHKDVLRLQQIRSLQQLGFSLKEIQNFLTRPDSTPIQVIEKHLKHLDEQIELQQYLRIRLKILIKRYKSAGKISVEELLQTIKEINMMDKYYTPEQLEKLKKRREKLGDATLRKAEEEWKEIFELFRKEMEKGTDPASDTVKKIAIRSAELIQSFTGGDPGITASLSNMYKKEGGPNIMAQHGIDLDPRVWEYMGMAMKALKS